MVEVFVNISSFPLPLPVRWRPVKVIVGAKLVVVVVDTEHVSPLLLLS